VRARCTEDGEFRLATRFWTGSVRLELPGAPLLVSLRDGAIVATAGAATQATLTVSAPDDLWAKLLAAVPPPMFNDIAPAAAFGLTVSGDTETYWQYYPAIQRLVQLLREEWNIDGAL
jgi:hypothetical protein